MSRDRPDSDRPEKRINPPGLTLTTAAVFLSGCGVVLIFWGWLTWFNHAYPERRNERLQTLRSPDGKRQAILFRRTSQGPENFTTHVTILPFGTPLPNRSGKAYIARGEPSLTIRWQDNNHLVIDDPDGTSVILRTVQVEDVKISGE